MTRSLPVLLAGALLTAAGACMPAPLEAQVVRGTLRDRLSGRPVAEAVITLHDTTGAPHSRFRSSQQGSFVLRAPQAGWYYISAQRLGYEITVSDTVPLVEGQELEVMMLVAPRPVEMEGVEAVASSTLIIDSWLVADFYRRAATGRGRFVTRAQIDRMAPTTLTDLLHTLPGVWAARTGPGFNDWVLAFRRPRVRSLGLRTEAQADSAQRYVTLRMADEDVCVPLFWLDGVEQRGALTTINLIEPSMIEGVEVYRSRLEMPGEYAKPGSECGGVLIWTRRGR